MYRDTIAALCEPVEDVSEASRKAVKTREAPAGRACQVTPSTIPLPAHLDDLYQRTISCLDEAPLHRLTEKDKAFVWTHECDVAFHQLKQVMSQAPVLVYLTSEGTFVLDTDASNTGIGEERVIAYFSRTITKSDRQCCVMRKELLALVTAVRHFHHYVYGRHFKVQIDHGALRWLMTFKNREGQTARWIETLSIYDLEVKHHQGRNHGNADGLSRRPCDNCRHCEQCWLLTLSNER